MEHIALGFVGHASGIFLFVRATFLRHHRVVHHRLKLISAELHVITPAHPGTIHAGSPASGSELPHDRIDAPAAAVRCVRADAQIDHLQVSRHQAVPRDHAPARADYGRAGGRDAYARGCEACSGSPHGCAEDDPVNLEEALARLEQAGFVIESAAYGEEAIAMAAGKPQAVILVDGQMPKLDGMRAMQCLRDLCGPAGKSIIGMTVNAFSEDKAQCMRARLDDFISMPADPETL